MEKIDRLVWAAGFCGSSFGVHFGVRANTPQALETLRQLLPASWEYSTKTEVKFLFSYIEGGPEKRAGVKHYNILYFGAARLARSLESLAIANSFENTLQITMASFAPRHVFVHAGAVGWRGRAIVIPGSSMSGKSTLTAALVRAGATYYSDEYAIFTQQGRLLPFARPLQLRQPEGQMQKVAAESLGGKVGVQSLPVGLVIETRYRPDCRWRPRSGSTGQGALALMSHAVPIQIRPARAVRVLTRAARTARLLKGTRGDADAVAERILYEFADW